VAASGRSSSADQRYTNKIAQRMHQTVTTSSRTTRDADLQKTVPAAASSQQRRSKSVDAARMRSRGAVSELVGAGQKKLKDSKSAAIDVRRSTTSSNRRPVSARSNADTKKTASMDSRRKQQHLVPDAGGQPSRSRSVDRHGLTTSKGGGGGSGDGDRATSKDRLRSRTLSVPDKSRVNGNTAVKSGNIGTGTGCSGGLTSAASTASGHAIARTGVGEARQPSSRDTEDGRNANGAGKQRQAVKGKSAGTAVPNSQVHHRFYNLHISLK